jgi:hypothetical protein
MDKRQCKPLMVSARTDKIANNDAHIETRFDMASQLRIALSTLNTNVKNHEASARSYIQCQTVYKQQKSLKPHQWRNRKSAIAACFKQACASNASVDGKIQAEGLQNMAYLGEQRLCWLDRQI